MQCRHMLANKKVDFLRLSRDLLSQSIAIFQSLLLRQMRLDFQKSGHRRNLKFKISAFYFQPEPDLLKQNLIVQQYSFVETSIVSKYIFISNFQSDSLMMRSSSPSYQTTLMSSFHKETTQTCLYNYNLICNKICHKTRER